MGIFETMKQAPGAISHFVADRLTSSGITDASEIPRGRGAIVHADGKRLAVYRDEDGNTHAMSPVCTHLKCIVAWNDALKSWDCPCHGSRYDPMGHVIKGPAKKRLAHEVLED